MEFTVEVSSSGVSPVSAASADTGSSDKVIANDMAMASTRFFMSNTPLQNYNFAFYERSGSGNPPLYALHIGYTKLYTIYRS